MMQPILVDFASWAQSLIIDFPTDNIPILGDDWKQWASVVAQENTFLSNDCPDPTTYTDKQAWAKDVYGAMANY